MDSTNPLSLNEHCELSGTALQHALNEGLRGWSAQIPSMHPFKRFIGGLWRQCKDPNISAERHLWATTALIPWLQRSVWNDWSECGWEPEMSQCSCLDSPTYCWSCVLVLFSSSDRLLWGKTQETTRLHSSLFSKAATHLKGNSCVCICLPLWRDKPLKHNSCLVKVMFNSLVCFQSVLDFNDHHSYLYRNSRLGWKGIFLFTYLVNAVYHTESCTT